MGMSYADEMACREGSLLPHAAGVNTASAGALSWTRQEGESAARFLGRVRAEAHAAGFKIAFITGAITTTASVTRLRGEEPPDAA